MGCSFLATSHILSYGADTKANNMSTNDDCYLGACNLMVFKRSDVLNEYAAKSIVLYFRNQTRASLNDRLIQKECDVTESINGNSDIFHLGTPSINRDPLGDKSICRLIKIAGTLSLEAVDALRSNFAVDNECMKYKNILGEYPTCYRGLGKCHLRALYSVLPQAAKLALSKKLKHHEASMIQACLQQLKGPKKGKVSQLGGMHWVSICHLFYVDNAYCWYVTNLKKLVKSLPNYQKAHIPLIHYARWSCKYNFWSLN